MGKGERRLRRQFDALGRAIPPARWVTMMLLAHNMRLTRLPIAMLMVVGGLFSFLPVLGVWMLPLGIMLLAVDFPFLQGPVTNVAIRIRRRFTVWRMQRRRAREDDRRRRKGLPPVARPQPPLD